MKHVITKRVAFVASVLLAAHAMSQNTETKKIKDLKVPFPKTPVLFHTPVSVNTRVAQPANGKTTHPNRWAWDFSLPMGTHIVASRAGVVRGHFKMMSSINSLGDWSNDNGLTINHLDGDKTRSCYVHLVKPWNDKGLGEYSKRPNGILRLGEYVIQGELVGLCGDTGWSGGPHLHFETYKWVRFADWDHKTKSDDAFQGRSDYPHRGDNMPAAKPVIPQELLRRYHQLYRACVRGDEMGLPAIGMSATEEIRRYEAIIAEGQRKENELRYKESKKFGPDGKMIEAPPEPAGKKKASKLSQRMKRSQQIISGAAVSKKEEKEPELLPDMPAEKYYYHRVLSEAREKIYQPIMLSRARKLIDDRKVLELKQLMEAMSYVALLDKPTDKRAAMALRNLKKLTTTPPSIPKSKMPLWRKNRDALMKWAVARKHEAMEDFISARELYLAAIEGSTSVFKKEVTVDFCEFCDRRYPFFLKDLKRLLYEAEYKVKSTENRRGTRASDLAYIERASKESWECCELLMTERIGAASNDSDKPAAQAKLEKAKQIFQKIQASLDKR